MLHTTAEAGQKLWFCCEVGMMCGFVLPYKVPDLVRWLYQFLKKNNFFKLFQLLLQCMKIKIFTEIIHQVLRKRHAYIPECNCY